MKAWQTTDLRRYLALARANEQDQPCPDRPSRDHIWVDGSGWEIPADLLDRKAAAAIDAMDRLQFEHLFSLENRVRALEGNADVTRAQYRQFLINRWKAIYGST